MDYQKILKGIHQEIEPYATIGKLAVHPLANPAISKGQATDEDSVVDGNFFTAKEEHYICTMMPQVLEALKK